MITFVRSTYGEQDLGELVIANYSCSLVDVDMAGSLGKRLKKVVAIEPAEGRGGEYYCPFIIIMTKTSGKKFVDRRRPSTRSQFAYKTDADARGSHSCETARARRKRHQRPIPIDRANQTHALSIPPKPK